MSNIAIDTEDESEELWAYDMLKRLYVESTISDEQVSFFDAMRWAAEVREGKALPKLLL